MVPSTSKRLVSLDGLRGIAVTMVMLSHSPLRAQIESFPLTGLMDGALGVRIFFVLSGFIITTLLLKTRREQARPFQLWAGFMLQRTTKLWPVLWLYTGVYFLYEQLVARQCGLRDYAVTLSYTTEFYNDGRICWFLAHSWSLSAEEWFYLIFGAVALARSAKKMRTFAVLLVVLLTSYELAILITNKIFSAQRSVYLPLFSSFRPIAIGCLFAMAWAHFPFAQWVKNRALPALASHRVLTGLATITALGIFFGLAHPDLVTAPIPFRYVSNTLISHNLESLLVGALILACVAGAQAPKRVLEFRPLTVLGRISYSVYIWQQFFLVRDVQAEFFQNRWWSVLGIFFCATVSFWVCEVWVCGWLRAKLKLKNSHIPLESELPRAA